MLVSILSLEIGVGAGYVRDPLWVLSKKKSWNWACLSLVLSMEMNSGLQKKEPSGFENNAEVQQ